MTLSPSQQRVLHAIQKNPIRYLPKGATVVTDNPYLWHLVKMIGCLWEWSRTIDLEANTSDYRRRIWEINQMPGYKILSFHAPWTGMLGSGYVKTITRHGYILIPPSEKEKELGL